MNHPPPTYKPRKRTQHQPQSSTEPADTGSRRAQLSRLQPAEPQHSPLTTMCWQVIYTYLCSCSNTECTSHRPGRTCPNHCIEGNPPDAEQPVQVCQDPGNSSFCKHIEEHKPCAASETHANPAIPSFCRQLQLSCNWEPAKGPSGAARQWKYGLSLPVVFRHQGRSRFWEEGRVLPTQWASKVYSIELFGWSDRASWYGAEWLVTRRCPSATNLLLQ